MNDPDSFEHVSTKYFDRGDYLIVNMKFRGKNAFGGLVIDYISAHYEISGDLIKIVKKIK